MTATHQARAYPSTIPCYEEGAAVKSLGVVFDDYRVIF